MYYMKICINFEFFSFLIGHSTKVLLKDKENQLNYESYGKNTCSSIALLSHIASETPSRKKLGALLFLTKTISTSNPTSVKEMKHC